MRSAFSVCFTVLCTGSSRFSLVKWRVFLFFSILIFCSYFLCSTAALAAVFLFLFLLFGWCGRKQVWILSSIYFFFFPAWRVRLIWPVRSSGSLGWVLRHGKQLFPNFHCGTVPVSQFWLLKCVLHFALSKAVISAGIFPSFWEKSRVRDAFPTSLRSIYLAEELFYPVTVKQIQAKARRKTK